MSLSLTLSLAAAAIGGSLGAAFGRPAALWAAETWTRHVLPAFEAVLESGILAFCG